MQISGGTLLSEWSEEWIRDILNNDRGEELLFDFKEGISSSDPKHTYNLRKAIASFANTYGGFLIFGIKDKAKASGRNRLCGISNTANFSKELTNKISGGKIVPHIFFEGPKIITFNYDANIYNIPIIKIASSELKPHALISDKDGLLEFWMRGASTAIAATYPYLTTMIEEAAQLKNWLAALYLDTEYIDQFATKMVVAEKDRGTQIPVVKISALINSEQSSQIISKIPTDIQLIGLIWRLRESIDLVNTFRDMMIARRTLPTTNAKEQNERDNDYIAANVSTLKELTEKVREHLKEKYAGVREWMTVVQQQNSAAS
jgi:hypothetical protein